MKKITQAEAHALQNKVKGLERLINDQRSAWGREWPDGTMIVSDLKVDPATYSAVRTARLLKHAVVVQEYDGILHFHAMEQPR